MLSVGVESAQTNAFAIDIRLMLGMAIGGALLSALTTLGVGGLSGRGDVS